MEHISEAASIIVAAMHRADRSQRWTAKRAAIAPTSFDRKIKGGSDFTVGELVRVAHALNVHPSELLPRDFILGEKKSAA